MTRKIAFAATAIAMFVLSACNTVHGAGKDMTSAGKAVSKASGEK
ncbi:entericidin A/B family lipoprotein [Sphingomonas sp. NPDC079357]